MDAHSSSHDHYNVSQEASEYIQMGWSPIPVPYKSKNPNRRGWQLERISARDVLRRFNDHAENVGVLLGEPSQGLVDVDLDCPEALSLSDDFLPTTGTVFGRAGKPRSHRLYLIDPLVETRQYEDTDGTMLLELRSTGAQTIFPSSIHPSGESILWDEAPHNGNVRPHGLDGRELRGYTDRLAAATLLARHWPAQGSRHEAAKALAGGLARAGWERDVIEGFIEVVAHAAGDDEAGQRPANVKTTERRLTNDAPATGWPTLAKLLGQDVVAKVCEWMGISWSRTEGAEQRDTTGAKTPKADRTQATRLVDLAIESVQELFHTFDSKPYATVNIGDHKEHWPLKSPEFRAWLCRKFYTEYGTIPGAQAMQDALSVLEGKALFDGVEHPVCVRLAEHDGAIYLDLANASWQAAKVTAEGWQLVDDPPVRFRRSKSMAALPLPEHGGSVSELRPFINIATDSDWVLLCGFLLGALNPRGPYIILILTGEQGSTKTTTARLAKASLDPNDAPVRSAPRSEQDLSIAAHNNRLLCFDNLSSMPQWFSDALSRLATGTGFSTRQLYTNDEESILNATRPIILTSIADIATQSDLLDRSIVLTLEPIPKDKRLTERKLWADFEKQRPRILGALLDAVSAAICNLPNVQLTETPRMADFAEWVVAGEEALGLQPGQFIRAYTANREDANELALEADPIAIKVQHFMAGEGGTSRSEWKGKASELLQALNKLVTDSERDADWWPKRGNKLSARLRILAPNLRQVGIDIQFPKRTGRGGRTITIRKRPQTTDTNDTGDTSTLDEGHKGDDTAEVGDDNFICGDGHGDDTLHISGDGDDRIHGDSDSSIEGSEREMATWKL